MKKALILANSSSGLYDFRNELLLGLMQEGYEVSVSLPDDRKVKELKDEGVKVIHTEINRRGVNPVQDMALYREYKRLLKSERPDLVITYTIKPNIYGGFACRMKKIPYISTITGLGSTFERGGILLRIIVLMYRAALKSCGCLFFQNDENRKIFEEHGIRGRKTTVVSGSGVNLSKHAFEDYPGHSDGVTRFLYIGRLMKEKGSEELLYAARKGHEKYGDGISFAAVGYAEDDFEERAKEAEKEGYLKTIPYQLDIHPYIRESDAVIHPSYHEGMSNVIMEAAATGRPVITTDIPGCREIVERDVTGLLCEPRSKEALYEAVERFMEMPADERAAMGKAARRYVEQKFDRRSIIQAYLEEIKKLVK